MSRQPTDAEHAGAGAGAGGRPRTTRRAPGLVALAATVAVLAGGLVGMDRLLPDDAPGSSSGPASTPTAAPDTVVAGPLEVSGSGVGTLPFGTDAAEVLAAVSARLGEPDLTVGPRAYVRIVGGDGWYAAADDPLSPSWRYPVLSVTCWDTLCLLFGGDAAGAVRLRGWELARHRRWSAPDEPEGTGGTEHLPPPDVRLAGTGIRLGDTWERLHAAYPGTVAGGAEGATWAVHRAPWAGVFDGVAGWRLSGRWDYSHPTRVPADAVVTRLSGGEGPQPGCC